MEERTLELIELNATLRETTGKGAARELRRNDAFPAVIYGAKTDSAKLSIKTSEFAKIIRINGSTGLFFSLKVEGGSGKERIAMLKDLQMDTFGLNYLHLDLQEIDMDTKVTVSVPVEAIGESVGVKEGGLLQIIRRELDVICKPADTPESVQIDITELAVGDAIHVEDIDLGEAIEIPHDVNFTVITIGAPSVEEEVEEDEDDLLEEGEAAAAPASEETSEG
jgi:large subunit ribosomal protein L25